MLILSTKDKAKVKTLPMKMQNLRFSVIVLFSVFSLLWYMPGCAKKDKLQTPNDLAEQSQIYYQRAVSGYKDLIKEGRDLDRLYFELGTLYYDHGELAQATEAFKKSETSQAEKLLAISYYKLGDFTDALEVFNKNQILDDEYLYYHGLTCEKLNLFDRALKIYSKIKDEEFFTLALQRTNNIEKSLNLTHIEQLSPLAHNILASAPSAEKYPQAGALILYCDEKIELTPQDTQVEHLHYIVKIINERGKEDFSEAHIDYDSTYEKVELEYARTIKPDGTVVEVGARHIRDVSKYLNFPLYSNVRVFIISFPSISEGASIEYKLKLYRNQLVNKKDFVISYPLQTSEPIISANFSVSIPKQKSLHIKIINEGYNNFQANLKPNIEEKNGYLIYDWQFKDIPQIIPEPNMPPDTEINPTMLLSTFDNWQAIYNWWWSLAQDKIKADAEIKSKVKELLRDLDSEEEKIRAIYNFCAQKIRYVAVEYGQAGYEPHQAEDIFKNKYGDCKDQSILLVAMLREAGLKAWPVLIATKDYYNLNQDFPSMLFNHCIAAVPFKDKIVFLDPTAETCSFGDLPVSDQGRKVLIFKENEFQIQETALFPTEHNLIKQSLQVIVDRDESITASKSIFSSGVYDQQQRYWLLYTPPLLIEQVLKEKIQGISIGAVLEEYDIQNLNDLNKTIVLTYVLKGSEYFTEAGSLRIMPQLSAVDTSIVAKAKRDYAIDFAILDSRETIFEIEIPNNFAVKYIPDNVRQDSPWLKCSAEYSHQGNKIYFRQRMEAKKNRVAESEYPDFKDFYENLAKKIKQRIVLEKIR